MLLPHIDVSVCDLLNAFESAHVLLIPSEYLSWILNSLAYIFCLLQPQSWMWSLEASSWLLSFPVSINFSLLYSMDWIMEFPTFSQFFFTKISTVFKKVYRHLAFYAWFQKKSVFSGRPVQVIILMAHASPVQNPWTTTSELWGHFSWKTPSFHKWTLEKWGQFLYLFLGPYSIEPTPYKQTRQGILET